MSAGCCCSCATIWRSTTPRWKCCSRRDAGASSGPGRRTCAVPVPFRNFVAQARLGSERAGARGVLPRACSGMWTSRRRRSVCSTCRAMARDIEEAHVAARSALAPAVAGAGAGSGGERGEPVPSGVGAGAGADVGTRRMWCSARCCLVACRAARVPTGRWACSSTRCRCASAVGDAGVEASVRADACGSWRSCCATSMPRWRWRSAAARCLRPLPLFSALLNYRHSPQAATAEALPAWEGIELLGGEERTNYPLTLSVDDLGDGFRADGAGADVGRCGACLRLHAHGAGASGRGAGDGAGARRRGASRRAARRRAASVAGGVERDRCGLSAGQVRPRAVRGTGGAERLMRWRWCSRIGS